MKILLAALMCIVFNATQCFAIDGGPWGGNGTVTAVTGTYAGIIVPIPVAIDPENPDVTSVDNSIALFTLSIPQTGLAKGEAAIFRNGFFYPGQIIGSADPDSGKLTSIVAGEFSQDRQSGTITVTEHYEANGFANAQIVSNSNISRVTLARIRGRASITYALGANGIDSLRGDSGGPIMYLIHGFKQSSSTS